MKFGPVSVDNAEGAILAHSLGLTKGAIKKGTVLGAADIERLKAAGHSEVIVARLEPGDVHEDEAAKRLAAAFAGGNAVTEAPFTGRVNLHAGAAGLLRVDKAGIDRLNRRDPAITVATLADFEAVEDGRLIATVKIIPYAVPGGALDAALTDLGETGPLIEVLPFRALKVGVISTLLPGLKPSIVEKTLRVLGERLAPAGATIVADERIAHDEAAVAGALGVLKGMGVDLIVMFGASAVVDRRDVLPAGIEAAGGAIVHFGMPVDPGNLLLVADLDGLPVLGAPGCARSPKENGFDWVLARLLAGVPVTTDDITGMGVGGLLMEIVSRPQPREVPVESSGAPKVAALVLAAGQSRRMGAANKLASTIGGKPMVRIAAEAALASAATSVTVVTGHEPETVHAALADLDVAFAHNPDFADGLSTSLATGLAALPDDVDAVVVMLADMPQVTPEIVDRLIAAYDPAAGALIVLPTFEKKRGNPVLWSRRFFDELKAITGDVGARHVLGRYPDAIAEVEIGAGVALDIDTPEALAAAGGQLPKKEQD
ncbi:MAG: 4-diphosphocytidyl-2C-methyl-D-erythritol kinase [Hyphomicrobiales bacterium]|nr:MAG: 4-diphosphocytidyl-2C-methyl-D-erythritol kinase [Hyphomicrobiales bacterium]